MDSTRDGKARLAGKLDALLVRAEKRDRSAMENVVALLRGNVPAELCVSRRQKYNRVISSGTSLP